MMAPGERKTRSAPPRRLTHRTESVGRRVPECGFAPPRAARTAKVPQRLKAPDFSNSDVQRATLAIHSFVLFLWVCVFSFSYLRV